MEGYATMYMRMPLTTSNLPVVGQCEVAGRHVTLQFPFTGIEFDLPSTPREDRNDYDFRIRGALGDMAMTLKYLKDLQCFHGTGHLDEDNRPLLSFTFYSSSSPMSKLPKMK